MSKEFWKQKKGRIGEEKATKYLKKLGYKILGTNCRWKRTQIDILTYFDDHYIAVEVKYCSDLDFFKISPGQIKNLTNYLDHFYPESPRAIEAVIIHKQKIIHLREL
jgi:Holliday junction resolvase-like predicted endonuclease